jgi:SAM-dependent methyltransferase
VQTKKLKRIRSKLAWVYTIPFTHYLDSVHVDLGSGHHPRNPFNASKLIATDHIHLFHSENNVQFLVQDLTKTLNFADNSIDSFSAYDVLEHIPRWERLPSGEIVFPFINLMSEIYRCLVPGGIFLAMTPAFPSPAAFQDPTHVNLISRETVNYFAGPTYARFLGYGFENSFEIIYENWAWAGLPLPENFSRVETRINGKGLKNALYRLVRRNDLIYAAYLWLKLSILRKKNPTHLLWILQKPIS